MFPFFAGPFTGRRQGRGLGHARPTAGHNSTSIYYRIPVSVLRHGSSQSHPPTYIIYEKNGVVVPGLGECLVVLVAGTRTCVAPRDDVLLFKPPAADCQWNLGCTAHKNACCVSRSLQGSTLPRNLYINLSLSPFLFLLSFPPPHNTTFTSLPLPLLGRPTLLAGRFNPLVNHLGLEERLSPSANMLFQTRMIAHPPGEETILFSGDLRHLFWGPGFGMFLCPCNPTALTCLACHLYLDVFVLTRAFRPGPAPTGARKNTVAKGTEAVPLVAKGPEAVPFLRLALWPHGFRAPKIKHFGCDVVKVSLVPFH